jgi:hypothetical protein
LRSENWGTNAERSRGRWFSDCSKNRGFPAKCGPLATCKWQILKEEDYMAEREGFEPSIELLTYNGLANLCFEATLLVQPAFQRLRLT